MKAIHFRFPERHYVNGIEPFSETIQINEQTSILPDVLSQRMILARNEVTVLFVRFCLLAGGTGVGLKAFNFTCQTMKHTQYPINYVFHNILKLSHARNKGDVNLYINRQTLM